QKTADDVNDVVGVHRGENEVSGQCRLDSNLRSLFVTNFADHDLVRIMAQNRSQAAGKGQPFLLVDRDLGDAVQLILDRVFDRDDLVFFIADFIQSSVQRRGFT